jgi:prolyl-tRNA editing enzyme YbaK/EbsC (Cys-tRNA(Pro) deacylase)
MEHALSPNAQRVQAALASASLQCSVQELPASTRTAQEAAAAVGCAVAQIAKSLVFRGKVTGTPYLVIASGANRVNEQRLSEWVSEPVEMPEAGFVRSVTGFPIGGVPPLGHDQPLRTFIDQAFLAYDAIWAAAGTPNAVFQIRPDDLIRATGGEVVSLM